MSLNIFTFCRYMYISRLGGGWGIFFNTRKVYNLRFLCVHFTYKINVPSNFYIYLRFPRINLVNNQRTLVPAGKKRLIFGWTNVKIFGLWIGILHCLIIADIVSSFNRLFIIEFKKQNYLKKKWKKMYPVWTIKSHSF